MPKLAMIVGISGVGKTTFVRRLSARLEFQHLTAGSLIAASKAAPECERDRLRLIDLDENQLHLIKGFDVSRDPTASLILLDGHVVIHTDSALQELGSEVFNQLGVAGFLHLSADPQQIVANRANDASRQRPALSTKEVGAHQKASLKATEGVAHALAIPWKVVTYEEVDVAERFLRSLMA